jgi:hypothetical protein
MTAHRTPLEDLLVSRLVMAVGFQGASPSTAASPWWATRCWPRPAHQGFAPYDELWPEFARDLAALGKLRPDDGRPLPVSECELVYVNPVTPVEQWPHSSRLERLLLGWFGDGAGGDLLPQPDQVVADAHFALPHHGAAPPGTMTISMQWVSAESAHPMVGLTFSARSPVPDGELDSVRSFFDSAFEWIVRGFAAVAESSPLGSPGPGAPLHPR